MTFGLPPRSGEPGDCPRCPCPSNISTHLTTNVICFHIDIYENASKRSDLDKEGIIPVIMAMCSRISSPNMGKGNRNIGRQTAAPSTHLLICSSSPHLLIYTCAHLHICSSSHLHIYTSAHLYICTSTHLLIFTSAHLHICRLRFSSVHDQEVLTIIIDGMGKWGTASPHLGQDKPSKDLDNIIRPKLVITAALCHGWGTFLFGTSELENHGADPCFLKINDWPLSNLLN